MDDATIDPDFELQGSAKRGPGRPPKNNVNSPKPPKQRKSTSGGRKPSTMKGWYKHKDFIEWYHLRCKLEEDLLNATIALPNSAGLTAGRIEELKRIFDREGKALPKTDAQWERDDLPRWVLDHTSPSVSFTLHGEGFCETYWQSWRPWVRAEPSPRTWVTAERLTTLFEYL